MKKLFKTLLILMVISFLSVQVITANDEPAKKEDENQQEVTDKEQEEGVENGLSEETLPETVEGEPSGEPQNEQQLDEEKESLDKDEFSNPEELDPNEQEELENEPVLEEQSEQNDSEEKEPEEQPEEVLPDIIPQLVKINPNDGLLMAFASDLHGSEDALENAFMGFPDVSYISLLGNMPRIDAETGEPAEYMSSEIYERLKNILPNLQHNDLSIISCIEDANIDDDLDILKFASGPIVEGVDDEGNVLCYVYTIGILNMIRGGEVSSSAAQTFKTWLSDKPQDIPVIVLSSLPLTVGSGLNVGAEYWHEALNYAATGVEGITVGEDRIGVPVKRNVILLSGHDYEIDPTEYVYFEDEMMNIQTDTTVGRDNSQDTKIYYNALTPGYLISSGNASLMTLNDDEILFTKYKNGETQEDWVSGESGENLGDTISIERIYPEPGPVIIAQPQDAEVNYPDGAEFHVEIENPGEDISYQWYATDNDGITNTPLEGITASTDTLVVVSTQRDLNVKFFCVITDGFGNETISDKAELKILNRHENKPVLYVGEYALEPGDTLNLSEQDMGGGLTLGEGVVSYDANASDITIENLNYDNSFYVAGGFLTRNVALCMDYFQQDIEEYHVHLIGENTIHNHYFNEDYNIKGIPFDFYFNGEQHVIPVVYIEGPGSLNIINGSIGLRVIGDLCISANITINQEDEIYSDGIVAKNNILIKDAMVILDVYGNGIVAEKGNLFTDNSVIMVDAHSPSLGQGSAKIAVLKADGTMNIEDSFVGVHSTSEQDICREVTSFRALEVGGELWVQKDSALAIFVESSEGTQPYLYDFKGIEAFNAHILDSIVSVEFDLKSNMGLTGITTLEDIEIDNSRVLMNLAGNHSISGVIVNGYFDEDTYTGKPLSITNSIFKLNIENSDETMDGNTFGVICGNFTVDLKDPEQEVTISVNEGRALSVVSSNFTDREVQPLPNYNARNIHVLGDTFCIEPLHNQINQTSIPLADGSNRYQTAETIYNETDMSLPLSISFKKGYIPLEKNLSWNRDKDNTLKLTVIGKGNEKDAISKFTKLVIDNYIVEPKYYTLEKGSVNITISKEYLKTLKDGTHIVKAIFQEGEAQFKLSVSSNPAPSPTPSPTPDEHGKGFNPPKTGIE